MRGFSKAILAGNLSRDPELRATSTGSQACSFTVAVNRAYKIQCPLLIVRLGESRAKLFINT